jgi:hypothetical protein
MIVQQPQRRQRGVARFLRALLGRAPNSLPAGATPAYQAHERGNIGYPAPPESEVRFAQKELLQRISLFTAASWLAEEFAHPPHAKGNSPRRALTLHPHYLAQDRLVPEKANPRALLLAILTQHPTSDAKDAGDLEMIVPNKGVFVSVDFDAATVQRAKFTRYLLQQGIFNEGFAEDELPSYYRTLDDYTKGDAEK